MSGEDRIKRILILGSANWQKVELLPQLAAWADWTLAVDGAWARAREHEVKVDLVMGDLDSLSQSENERLLGSSVRTIRHPEQKDQTDLELALDYVLALEPEEVILFGVLGGRLDQSLMNVFLLEKAVRTGVACRIIAGEEQVYLVSDQLKLPQATPGETVSLLPLTSTVRGVETWGLKYGLNREDLFRASSRGISNQVVTTPAGVKVQEGLLLVIHKELILNLKSDTIG